MNWRRICKNNPLIWRTIDMRNDGDLQTTPLISAVVNWWILISTTSAPMSCFSISLMGGENEGAPRQCFNIITAQKVCSKWFKICKDPLMWCTVNIHNKCHSLDLCENAVDRSCANLVDINVENFGTVSLLNYLAERSSGLKRLFLVGCHNITDEGFREISNVGGP